MGAGAGVAATGVAAAAAIETGSRCSSSASRVGMPRGARWLPTYLPGVLPSMSVSTPAPRRTAIFELGYESPDGGPLAARLVQLFKISNGFSVRIVIRQPWVAPSVFCVLSHADAARSSQPEAALRFALEGNMAPKRVRFALEDARCDDKEYRHKFRQQKLENAWRPQG